MRGLQGYQLSFPRKQYAATKSALIRQIGPPTHERLEWENTAEGGADVVDVLEWRGEQTVAVMKESGRRIRDVPQPEENAVMNEGNARRMLRMGLS
jgi:hypothetical protein